MPLREPTETDFFRYLRLETLL